MRCGLWTGGGRYRSVDWNSILSTLSLTLVKELLSLGATVVPVIISSDKTRLSQFRGDKSAWPVYLTIGNISKDIRRQASSRATVLIGYLPVGKFDCFTEKARQATRYHTFHHCMSILTESLVSAGTDGVDMTCPDGFGRFLLLMWPITQSNALLHAVWRIGVPFAK